MPLSRLICRSFRSALVLLVCFGLGACTQLQELAQEPATKAPAKSQKETRKTDPIPDKIVRLPARQKPPTHRDIREREPGYLLALLGQPVLRRFDPPAQHWRYDAKSCSLHLYFYRRGDRYQLAHSDARKPRQAGQKTLPTAISKDTCISEIWRSGPNYRKVGES